MQWVRATDDTFCIAVLGDFLGEAFGAPGTEGMTWIPQRATPDSVLNLVGLRPRIQASLHLGGAGETLEFTSLQSFDPGEFFQKMEMYKPLREAREAAKLGRQEEVAHPEERPLETPGTEEAGGANLLDAILDVTQPSREAPPPGTPEEIEAFVREVVRPHLVRDDSDAKTRIAAVDQAASLRVSDLLHTEAFQRLEALWRSLVFLLSRVDTTRKVRVYLVHLPREELERDLSPEADPRRSRLFDLLGSPELGAPGRRWAVAAGAYRFGSDADEVGLLARIAGIAQAADVPWISAIDPTPSAGDEGPGSSLERWISDPGDAWQSFRRSPEAAWMGLTHPRFLLREPYGEATRRVRGFGFEEKVESWDHLLWGDGPFLPVALLAQGFASDGWGFPTERHLDLGGMPLGNIPGGVGVSPTSMEVSLSPGEARRLMEEGIMPLVGFSERAGIRVGGIHPLSGPGRRLEGWWRR